MVTGKRAIGPGYQKHISKPAEPEELALAIAAPVGKDSIIPSVNLQNCP